tara:strand:+ start:555 stop:851 length:297 start_codon:yes stop_codon:yes gene_type:complete
MKYLGNIGYADPNKNADQNTLTNQTITKQTATSALGMVKIMEMGTDEATGSKSVEKANWVLQNAFITEVNFGEHSYDSEDMIDIQLTIQYDWATYTVK